MSKLKELIDRLCPEGVSHQKLGELIEIYTGEQFNKRDMNSSGTYPVINGGISPSGYIETFNEQADTITISQGGASAGYVAWQSIPFWCGAHCYIVRSTTNILLNRFLFYLLKNSEQTLQQLQHGAGIPALNRDKVKNLIIPVPPLEVQEEIVRILDTFTAHAAELQAELQARKEQYEYYRNLLLTFNPSAYGCGPDGKQKIKNVNTPPSKTYEINWKTLGEITYIPKERVNIKQVPNSLYVGVENLLKNRAGFSPAIVLPDVHDVIRFNKHDILIGNIRPYLKKIWLADQNGGTNGDVILIRIKDEMETIISFKYLYHVLASDNFFFYHNQYAKGAKMPRGDKEKVLLYSIPIPPLEVQERIVSLLDRFETLVNDLTNGLPAHIATVKEQYEYYRNKLLTFKKLA